MGRSCRACVANQRLVYVMFLRRGLVIAKFHLLLVSLLHNDSCTKNYASYSNFKGTPESILGFYLAGF